MCGWARLRDAAISSGAGNDEAKPNGAFAPGLWLWFLTLTFVLGISGCSSGSFVKAGAISVTDPSEKTSGQISSIGAGSIVQVNMTPVGDTTNAGVNWTVACGGSPVTGSVTGGACGTLVPAHTPDGVASMFTAPSIIPIGNTVTITAAVASDPAATSSISLPVVAQPISLSFVSPPATVDLGGKVNLQVKLLNGTAGDAIQWTAACGSSACGSFPNSGVGGQDDTYTAPASMPASGNTVQITAALVSDPSISGTATLTILPSLISVTPTADTLPTGGAARFTIALSNSIASGGAELTLSCGSPGNCGSFSGSTTTQVSSGQAVQYTAPAAMPSGGGTVTLTATALSQQTQLATALITVVQAPTIAFSQTPTASLTAGAQTTASATVTDDIPPGGVTWTLKCGNTAAGGCGSIQPYKTPSGQLATYTAPPATTTGTTVMLVATSTADSSVSVTSQGIAITPATTISIAFVAPVPSQLQPAATVAVNAAVSNDSQNEGVDWQLCATNCGYFTIKPAIPAIPATATTPFEPAVPPVTAISVKAWPNGLPIPYTASIEPPSSGVVTITATAHADPTTSATSSVNITNAGTGPALNGTVMAGSQPVVGAAVQLFEAGTIGYGSAANPLTSPNSTTSVVTGSNGNFTIPAGYSCAQSSSQIYVVATGGSVGTNQPNSDLAMMTALGPCGNLSSQAFFVNEVTTVASVWPLAPFAANDPLTGKSSYLYLGTSSGNTGGLSDAFATVNSLVNISTGQARFFVPAGNAAAPYVEVNTLADILNACTATSGGSEGDGSACGDLLANTDSLGYNSLFRSAPPKDTLQAAFNIAQHPTSGFGYDINGGYDAAPSFFSLISLASPFQPILKRAPNDFSLSLNFTGGGGLSPSSAANYFAVDASDNLWITDSNAGTVIEWNNQGAALSPATGFAAGGGPMAIDSTGNIWISGNNTLTELSDLGSPYPWSPYKGIAGGGADMAFDAAGDLWIANGGGVAEYTDLGVELSPANGYVNSGVTGINAVAVDSADNVWVSGATVAELSDASGQVIVNTSIGGNGALQIAADGSGGIWIPIAQGGGGFCKVQPANTLLLYQYTCPSGGPGGGSPAFDTIYAPQGVAVDGAGYVWIANAGSTSNNIPPNVTEIDAGDLGDYLYAGYESPSLAAGPLHKAVDRAGNLWVLLAGGTVTEYVGLATPAVTPIALGVKNKKLGAKP